MTEPTDETQTQPIVPPTPDETPASAADRAATPGVIVPPPGPATGGGVPGPVGPAGPEPPAPPIDPAGPPVAPPAEPPLRADPNRPAASEWREPPWFPPRERPRDRRPSLVPIVVGLVILAIGVYYLLDVTLGLDLPRFRISSLWPLLLVAIGGLIVVRALGRR